MGIIIAPQQKIDEYFESDRLSQSTLKKLINGVESFKNSKKDKKELYYCEKNHFIIGSAVDTYLTGEDNSYHEKYYTSTLERKPSEIEMSMIQSVFDKLKDKIDIKDIEDISNYPNEISESIEEHNWQSKWKIETKISKLVESGYDYFEELKLSVGKQILSKEESETIDVVVRSLTTNKRTSKYFDRKALSRASGVSVYYQLPIYFDYKDVECKALLDILIVIRDDANRVVSITPLDLKTTSGNTLDFHKSYKKFRYDIQAAYYLQALEESCTNLLNITVEEFKNTIKPFTFIVESITYPGNPLLFVVDEKSRSGKYGVEDYKLQNITDQLEYSNHWGESIVLVEKVLGFDRLIDIYKYQSKNNWEEDEIVTKNNGILTVDWGGIL